MFTRTGNRIGGVARILATLIGSSALLAACGGGGGGGTAPAPTLTVGGTVSGLAGGSVVLRNNGTNDLTVGSNGAFTFSNSIASGASYSVTVATQPTNPAQTCTVANGAGNASAAVTNITVTCTTNTFSLGGTVSGLTGTGLVLANGATNLPVNANGAFTFASAIPSGTAYAVTVGTQPTGQTCSVANGTGSIGSAAVTNVAVTCASNAYTVSGTISGLTGTGLILQNNGGSDLARPAGATAFSFPTAVAGGSPYAVTVLSNPSGPSQTCTVANGSGTSAGINVTNVAVTCATNTYPVNVNVSGLTGTGLVLRNNGTQSLTITGNGTATFGPTVSGGNYSVTVQTQPTGPAQNCSITNGSGVVTNGAVTVNVACSTNSYTIGFTVSGLSGTGLQLTNNGGNTVSVSANGSFTFLAPVASGGAYAVAVSQQPTSPSQTCVVGNGSGTVASANITNITITCTTTTFTVGGTVSGLSGTGLQLKNNNGTALAVSANGSFTFPTAVNSGGAYAVTVFAQPATPAQSCVVGNGSGTVAAANITSVTITCTTTTFTVGGSVSGLLSGTTVVLQNNAGDNKTITLNGSFTFTTAVADAGAYAVTVLTQPTWDPATSTTPPRTCDVKTGSGTVSGANVTSVKVVCRPRFAFVANRSGDGALTSFSIGSTGALTRIDSETVQSALAPGATEADAEGVATTPTATHAFVSVDGALADPAALTTAGIIRIYDVAADGQMTFARNTAVPNVTPTPNRVSDPLTILVHPGMNVSDGAGRRRVYVMDANPDIASLVGPGSGNEFIHEYSFTYATATLTRQGGISVPSLQGVVMDPLGEWVFASKYTGHQIVPLKINATTGALEAQAGGVSTTVGTVDSDIVVTIDPTGTLLFAAHNVDAKIYVYEIQRGTGALVLKDTKDTWTSPELTTPVVALLVSPDTSKPILYAARADGKVQQYTITGATGNVYTIALTATATRTQINPAHTRFRLHMDSEGQTLYHIDWNTSGDFGLFRPNATTGLLDTPATLFMPQNVGGTDLTGTMGMTMP